MHIKEPDIFLLGVQHVLALPIRTRCAELTVLLDRATLLELHSFFPVLIENIFGPQGTLSWGLRTTTECQAEDFRQLQHFLSPCGPLFKLIYTLLKDSSIRYEFPIAYLPTKIRQFLENSQGHPFYSELIHTSPQSKQVVSILLRTISILLSIYVDIRSMHEWKRTLEDTSIANVFLLKSMHSLHNGEIIFGEHLPRSSGLINTKSLKKSNEESFQKNLDIHHPRNDIWRSETVLTVFTDMWLHSNQINEPMNNSFNHSPTRLLYHNELPTGEYMRIVRVLIKQLHSFSASAKADDTPLSELKKIAIPMIQGKFYIFLRNLIHQWPLDGSFRLVLELWLTYIQPWRYPPNNLIKYVNRKDPNPDVDDITIAQQHSVEREFLSFIAENLLCYVIIFQQLLPRFGRVDLVSPKMSLMLYRITKVFSQPNLPAFLREVEQCVENNNSPTHKYNDHWKNNLPPLSPTSNWSTNTTVQKNLTMDASRKPDFTSTVNTTSFLSSKLLHMEKKWSAVVRQKIFELEGPNFYFKPLFSDPPVPEVFDLIIQIKRSILQAQEIVRIKEQEEEKMYSGLWGQIKYFFSNPASNDEFTLRDRQKVPMYLQVSLQNLMDMFNITTEVCDREPEHSYTTQSTSFDMSNDFKFLTPERVRSRIRNIKYDGDPDLHPIRSTENAFLVRSLYQVSLRINEVYGPTFYRLYHNQTFIGRLSRELLCPPVTVYRYDKTIPGSPRVGTNLAPRISLRFIANYKFLTYLFIGALIAWVLGYKLETYLLFIVLLVLLYKSFRAVRSSRTPFVRHNYPTEGFGNISFNDSF